MDTTTLKWTLCASSLVLSLGCASESDPSASTEPSPEAAPSAPAPMLVPPYEGTYDQMWSALRVLESVSQPIASDSAKQVLASLDENDGLAPAGSVEPRPMIINLGTPEQESLWSVAYTDGNLLKPDTYAIVRPPREALLDALYNEHIQGLSFNPYTAVSKQEVFNFNVDKLYIAGLIGYLAAEDAEPGRRCQAANAAYAAQKPFETLHHALRALDDSEEWSQCELAKLWAMWELDFPGSRAMAYEELEWFIDKGNDTVETRTMLELFRSPSTPSP